MAFPLRARLLALALCVACAGAVAAEHGHAAASSSPRPPHTDLRGDLLALFLTRLAEAAESGDPGRVAAFLDEMTGVEFYKSYGLARFNERVADVAYKRYLSAYAEGKPRLVGSMMRSSLVITTGTALPMIVEGRFEGRAFAVSAASLGISTAAVKTGAAAIDWVKDLDQAKREGILARFGAKAGRVAKLSGWYYQVAEQAVIIYFTERIEPEIRRALDEREWRKELASEIASFLRAIGADSAPHDALAAHHEAWIRYRNRFYAAAESHDRDFDECLAGVTRRAKKIADETSKAIEILPERPALRDMARRRHGSVEAYMAHLFRRDRVRIDERFAACLERYNAARNEVLTGIYEHGRRDVPLLAGLEHRDRLLGDALEGEFAWALLDALENVSPNRIESYDDEIEILGGVARALRARARDAVASAIEEKARAAARLKALDLELYRGSGLVETRR